MAGALSLLVLWVYRSGGGPSIQISDWYVRLLISAAYLGEFRGVCVSGCGGGRAQGVWGYGEVVDGTGQRLGFQGWYATTCAGVLSSWARYQLAAVGTTVPFLLLAWDQLLASASVESDVVDQTFESSTLK